VRQVVANVDEGNAVGTIDGDFPVVALDGQGAQVGGVTVTPTTAHVHITMGKVPAARVLFVSANYLGVRYPYRVTGIDISPQSVTVTGRPELLAHASTVLTAPIDLSTATGDVTRQVVCMPPPGLAISGPDRVTVTFHIAAPVSVPGPTPQAVPTPSPAGDPNAPKPQ
jgi:YbbR domain-containing protein